MGIIHMIKNIFTLESIMKYMKPFSSVMPITQQIQH